MRRSALTRATLILATLALGLQGVPAMAWVTRAVDAYPGTYDGSPGVVTSRAGSITIGNPRAERDAVLALLDEHRFRQSDDTMAGEPAGGSGLGGSAGGVGAR
jgi:hypothetical protein